MKKLKLVFLIVVVGILSVNAQVKGPDRIVGKYDGELKKEIASGKGKSVGTDTYEGEFKKGYPQGIGTYIFGNVLEIKGIKFAKGDRYEGMFDAGYFSGKGKVIFADTAKEILTGYWSKNEYTGKTEKGFEVIKKENIVRVVIKKNGASPNNIEITGLDQMIEVGNTNAEFNGESKYIDLPFGKFPFILHIRGSAPTTGIKGELRVLIETPGNWSINIETN